MILIDAYPRHDWLMGAVEKRLREELADLQVEINEEKSRIVDLGRGESFGFLGFDFRRIRSRRGVWRANYTPKLKKRTALLRKLKDVFRRYQSQPVDRVDAVDQPGAARLGELLCGWALQRVLQLHQRLGGEEDPAPHAAGSETKGLRLDAVE